MLGLFSANCKRLDDYPGSFPGHAGLKKSPQNEIPEHIDERPNKQLPFRFSRVDCFFIASLVLGLLLGLSPIAYCSSRTFWVAPNGSDQSPGTRQKPFLTLERARDAVRAVNSGKGPGGDIIVYLRGGAYRLKQTFVLDWRDSGRNGFDVVYSAAPGEHPVISGSIRVTDWSLHDSVSGIYSAHVGQCATRQLYVNDSRATRAHTDSYPAGFRPASVDIYGNPGAGGIEFIPSSLNPRKWWDPAEWTNKKDIEAVIVTQWKMMRVPLDSVIPYPNYVPTPLLPYFKTGLITLQDPAWSNANVFLDSNTLQPGIWSFWQVTWFENAYEFLDEPGEWYLNKAEGKLYYIPRDDEDLATADVELPLLEVLVEGQGTLNNPVSNIRFEGLTFSCATWLDPSSSNGYVADQSGFHLVGDGHVPNIIGHDSNDARTPGNVRFLFAHNITFRGNIFEHLGGVGLDFDTGSQGNTIEGNLFEDISSAAIQLGGISTDDHHPERPEQVTSDNIISNNLIRHVAQEYVDAAGIYAGFTRRTTISNNTIVDVPWSGIAMGWGWGLLDPGGFPGVPGAQSSEWGIYTTPTPNSRNKIIENYIYGFLDRLWDGGAIYTTGWQGTSSADALLIEGNVASNKRPKGGGNTFYTDGGSRYINLQNNASVNNPRGVMDLGPPPGKGDPLPYSSIPSEVDGIPYGDDRGGCRTYGDISFTGNYWEYSDFFDICPYSQDGVSYPTDMISKHNQDIMGEADVPKSLLQAAGVQKRPPQIPADRWILP
jgi:hypothetical protein